MYDADDIIDYAAAAAASLTSPASSALPGFSIVSCFKRIPARHRIGSRIRSINARLDEISMEKAQFQLVTSSDQHRKVVGRVSRQTSPLLETDVVGAEFNDDAKNLIQLLTIEDVQSATVIGIVGMGGIGKTTLAQKIFNDEAIRVKFQIPPIWVCVSQDFSDISLLREIMRCAGENPGGAHSRGLLEPMLSRAVEHKKFFLILDDVWDARVWEDLLRKPLQSGGPGSRVLITTRDEGVAMQMGAVHLHRMKLLSIDDSWLLLHKMVFLNGDEGEVQRLRDIGMAIVKKCNGLPLAIKSIAGVLRTRDRRQPEWEKILRSSAWSLTELPEGVMGALYLSYEDLPSHLKQCFVYCSLYPEDYVFWQHFLIQRWIAEGFVAAEGNLTMEEQAENYYDELLQRSLLQPDPTYYGKTGCKIHDLLRSLAQFVAQEENFMGDVGSLNKSNGLIPSPVRPRRLLIVDREAAAIPTISRDWESLRTLTLTNAASIRYISNDLFHVLKCLRVLDISETMFESLPDSLGNIGHLRHLDISKTLVKEIPETIGRLRNLQFLIAHHCPSLQNLPKGIRKLQMLRSLNLHKTPVTGMPTGVGGLQHLNTLAGFVANNNSCKEADGDVGQTELCTLEELRYLYQLRVLTMDKLEKASSAEEARKAALGEKPHLELLELHCTPFRADGQPYDAVEDKDEIKRMEKVFEQLRPPSSIEVLDIEGFFGLEYPTWMNMATPSTSPLCNLKRLELVDCRLCCQLPPLGQLPQLDYLHIRRAFAVVTIGSDFFRDAGSAYPFLFPKLEILILVDMPSWEEWQCEWRDEMIAFPSLRVLHIEKCPKLRSLPEALLRHANKLRELWIGGTDSLKSIKDLNFVREMGVYSSPCLENISNLPSLERLKIYNCKALRHVGKLDMLRHLELEDAVTDSLPEWLTTESFVKLQKLDMVGRIHLLRRCLVGAPDWPKIQHIPLVNAHNWSKSKYIYYTRSPFTMNTNLDGESNG